MDWRITEIGQGAVVAKNGAITLTNQATVAGLYSDAQISDYALAADFKWRPPVRLTVIARARPGATQLHGTAGFGFWNQPFMPGQRGFRLPQAIWFFFMSPPGNLQLAQGVAGAGWKAATVDAKRWQFLALAPAAPLGVLMMRVPALYNRLWPIGQQAIGVSETLLDSRLLAETHTYCLDWRTDGATFSVDDRVVHQAPLAPAGPLGFVAWIDNQYAIVTPQGRLGFGLLPLGQSQTLYLEHIKIETDE